MPYPALDPEHPKTRPMVSTAYSQAKEWQGLLIAATKQAGLKALELSSLARVWAELEECKRKLKMKPLPGSLRPTSAKPQRKVKDRAEFSPAPAADTTGSAPPAGQ